MSTIAIEAHGLSKRYRIGVKQQRRDTLTAAVLEFLGRPIVNFRRLRQLSRFDPTEGEDSADSIWALKDASLEVRRGEVLGVIGRNGSGKSTLLKILSRITHPTEGHARIHGRVGSLLEVGTGFHPDLTGRENVYLNGTILGMRAAEIDRKFTEIVDFSGVENFIDTPVKRYSSGMKVRLGFAVAAHLDPEILLVDEVLAVGDVAFQQKCLGKLDDVTREGRTVLFVSHNMVAVESLCQRAILLEGGRLVASGPTSEIVQYHLATTLASAARTPLSQRSDRSGDGSVTLCSLKIAPVGPDPFVRPASRLSLAIEYRSDRPIRYAQFILTIQDTHRTRLFRLTSDSPGALPDTLPATGTVTCLTDPINLTPGRCHVNVSVLRGGILADSVLHAARFKVEPGEFVGYGKLPRRDAALCLLRHTWSLDATHGAEDGQAPQRPSGSATLPIDTGKVPRSSSL